jgi:hypothetical protein
MLAKTEIRELDMTVLVDQNVVRFYISMNVLQVVNRFYRQNHLRRVKSGLVMAKNVFFDQEVHQVASWYVIHYQVQKFGILKRTLESNNPRVVLGIGEHVSLLPDLNHFVLIYHFSLL